MHKLKTLGLALIAIASVGAASAGATSAAEFHSEAAHTELVGTQHGTQDTYTFNPGTARCKEITYTGTQATATTSTITVTPVYSFCILWGFIFGTISTNGCGFLLHTEAGTVNPVTGSGVGKVTIECPAGKYLDFNAPGLCDVHVGAQGPLAGVTFTNTGAHSGNGRDLTIDMNLKNIKYDTINTGSCLTSTYTSGTLVGALTLQGRSTEGSAVGVWAH